MAVLTTAAEFYIIHQYEKYEKYDLTAMKEGMMDCLEHYYEVFETKKFNDK